MSVILAYCPGPRDSTWIASDTMAISGSLRIDCGPKWIVHGRWAAGVAGYLRSVNLMEESTARLLDGLDGPYDFVDRAQQLFRSDGYREEREERGPANLGQVILLATAGRAWIIGGDFSVVEIQHGRLWAEGSGRELAIGAGHALIGLEQPPPAAEIVRRSLAAAIALDTTCGGRLWMAEIVHDPGVALPAAAPPKRKRPGRRSGD